MFSDLAAEPHHLAPGRRVHDPRMHRPTKPWSACMTGAGYDVRSPDEAEEQAAAATVAAAPSSPPRCSRRRSRWRWPTSPAAPRPGTTEVTLTAWHAAQQEFVDAHAEQLEALVEAHRLGAGLPGRCGSDLPAVGGTCHGGAMTVSRTHVLRYRVHAQQLDRPPRTDRRPDDAAVLDLGVAGHRTGRRPVGARAAGCAGPLGQGVADRARDGLDRPGASPHAYRRADLPAVERRRCARSPRRTPPPASGPPSRPLPGPDIPVLDALAAGGADHARGGRGPRGQGHALHAHDGAG